MSEMNVHCEITRREALVAGAAAALLSPAAALAARRVVQQQALTIGISTLGFNAQTIRQLAAELAQQGIRTVQLFLNQTDSRYWKYNGRSDVSAMTPDRCARIADDYRSAGLVLHSLGVYTNLIHPDPSERKANLEYFEAMMRIAKAMGIRALVTESGHYRSEKPEPAVGYDFQEPVWTQMVATGKELARMADRHDVIVLFEGFYRGFLASAKRIRLYLEAIGSPRVRALLDPANLIEINDLEEMFAQLSPWIECLHAKDRKLHTDRGVPAGQGDLDYRKFVALAARYTPKAPLVLEYVGPKDYQQALAHLRGAIAQAGLKAR
jgi:sugar phosphate isomerase/epimerase